jgi:menaquinone-dependent protoporphyrinogen IX oxidase
MNALVVFDTQFGNTEQIARAIAAALSPAFAVRLEQAGQIARLDAEPIDLLIVGGPTHRQKMTADLEAVLQATPRKSLAGRKAAAFDTRYRMAAWLTGSPAHKTAHMLKKLGAQLVAPPESFYVQRDDPPQGQKRRHDVERLEAGEAERAAEWARMVVAAARSS